MKTRYRSKRQRFPVQTYRGKRAGLKYEQAARNRQRCLSGSERRHDYWMRTSRRWYDKWLKQCNA